MGTIRPYKVVEDRFESQASYTIDIDLPNKGRFSMLNLLVKARMLSTGVLGSPWMKHLISSVSVNQGGSSHLNSAPPETFQADAYYKTGKMHRAGYQVMGGHATEVIESIPILFGESMNDPNYGIDLSKLSDPQLSITYDVTTTDIVPASVWTEAYYPRFTPILYLQEGVWPALQGYQSLRQIDSYTPANSEEHRTELKGGRPIKRVYAQLDIATAGFNWIHSLVKGKLWGDNERYKPFEMDIEWWYEIIRDAFGMCEFNANLNYGDSGATFDAVVGHYETLHGKISNAEYHGYVGMTSGRAATIMWRKLVDGSDPGVGLNSRWELYARGYTPWNHLVIDVEKMLGVDWFDAEIHKPTYLQLDHVSNAAAIGGPVNIHIADKGLQV